MASGKDSSIVKRKLWTEESMTAAVNSIHHENKRLREAARLYNIPVETLGRHACGIVEEECKPGPSTVLTDEEEERLSSYLIEMADMGFSLSRDAVMEMAFMIVDRNQTFKDGKAGRTWFEGFERGHPNLTLRSPQPLSYSRVLCSNQETIDDFFWQNWSTIWTTKPHFKAHVNFNVDETGVSIVHKPGKVIAELGRRNVYSITSAEIGKTHKIIACVSKSGSVLPPMMVYLRKKSVPEKLKEGAVPSTLFTNSESGWPNYELYLEWFIFFFLQQIPRVRPVLLLQYGHSSHISFELIELARANNIHLLCLPAHSTHIATTRLNVGAFKSFKTNISKACGKYLSRHPGRITLDVLASLVAKLGLTLSPQSTL